MLAHAMFQAQQPETVRVRSIVITTAPRAQSEENATTESSSSPQRSGDGGPLSELHAFLQTLTMTMQANGFQQVPFGQHANGTNFQEVLRNMFNPANAVHGDTVFTQEAFDRIMSQMMDANATNAGPGPASNAAIEALPRQNLDASMMGTDGKAECSVCMDNVSIGEEVTVLPCRHWFHEQCVTIWLKEHDTCPQCRQGISRETTSHVPSDISESAPPAANTRSQQTPRPRLSRGGTSSGVSSWFRNLRGDHRS